MLFSIFVRSVEDGFEPSQTYDEVNKLLLLLLLLLLLQIIGGALRINAISYIFNGRCSYIAPVSSFIGRWRVFIFGTMIANDM